MRDPRITQLARNLITHSIALQPGERILIDLFDTPADMGIALIQAAREVGGLPYVNVQDARLTRELEPNHCAMISVRKVEPNPQVVSTNRHILQGWVALELLPGRCRQALRLRSRHRRFRRLCPLDRRWLGLHRGLHGGGLHVGGCWSLQCC